MTFLTQLVLAAVEHRPGLSEREVGERVGVADQREIARLLGHLQERGLLESTVDRAPGIPGGWWLTPCGERFLSMSDRYQKDTVWCDQRGDSES